MRRIYQQAPILKDEASRAYSASMTDQPDKPTQPAAPRNKGLVWPPNCREVPGVPFAIIGAEHLRPRPPKLADSAPSPAPSPDAPERK